MEIAVTKFGRKVWAQCLSLGGQTLAALGTARIDHSAATTCFHADQKAVCTGAACFRRLVSAFHFESSQVSDPPYHMVVLGVTRDYRKLSGGWQTRIGESPEKTRRQFENSGL